MRPRAIEYRKGEILTYDLKNKLLCFKTNEYSNLKTTSRIIEKEFKAVAFRNREFSESNNKLLGLAITEDNVLTAILNSELNFPESTCLHKSQNFLPGYNFDFVIHCPSSKEDFDHYVFIASEKDSNRPSTYVVFSYYIKISEKMIIKKVEECVRREDEIVVITRFSTSSYQQIKEVEAFCSKAKSKTYLNLLYSNGDYCILPLEKNAQPILVDKWLRFASIALVKRKDEEDYSRYLNTPLDDSHYWLWGLNYAESKLHLAECCIPAHHSKPKIKLRITFHIPRQEFKGNMPGKVNVSGRYVAVQSQKAGMIWALFGTEPNCMPNNVITGSRANFFVDSTFFTFNDEGDLIWINVEDQSLWEGGGLHHNRLWHRKMTTLILSEEGKNKYPEQKVACGREHIVAIREKNHIVYNNRSHILQVSESLIKRATRLPSVEHQCKWTDITAVPPFRTNGPEFFYLYGEKHEKNPETFCLFNKYTQNLSICYFKQNELKMRTFWGKSILHDVSAYCVASPSVLYWQDGKLHVRTTYFDNSCRIYHSFYVKHEDQKIHNVVQIEFLRDRIIVLTDNGRLLMSPICKSLICRTAEDDFSIGNSIAKAVSNLKKGNWQKIKMNGIENKITKIKRGAGRLVCMTAKQKTSFWPYLDKDSVKENTFTTFREYIFQDSICIDRDRDRYAEIWLPVLKVRTPYPANLFQFSFAVITSLLSPIYNFFIRKNSILP